MTQREDPWLFLSSANVSDALRSKGKPFQSMDGGIRPLQPTMPTRTFSLGPFARAGRTVARVAARPAVTTEVCFRKVRRLIECCIATEKRFPDTLTRKLCAQLSAKRHGAAALQDLAEVVACYSARQRLGVRQPHAAFGLNCCCLPSAWLCAVQLKS